MGTQPWDLEADVVVLGSGAAGLLTAIVAHDHGASVVLLEKADTVGGTSAVSGGILWIPDNHHLHEAGLSDSRDEALAYLGALSLGRIDSDLAAVLVDAGPRMLRWVEEHTPAKFQVVPGYPDYHPEHPGGKPGGGRSLDNLPFSFRKLGEWSDRVLRSDRVHHFTLTETPLGGGRYQVAPEEYQARQESDQRGLGQALVGAMLRGCLDRGIEPLLATPARELLSEDGRVVGVVAVRDGVEIRVRARKAVVLATGGFEWDESLRREFLHAPLEAPASPPDNTGDGLRMAMSLGAALGSMAEAWWVPCLRIPGETWKGQPRSRLVLAERTYPRSIMVNRTGRRFCNEATNYNALGNVFQAFDPVSFTWANVPAWLVFDHGYRTRYPVGPLSPGAPDPDWLTVAPTPEALGAALGIDGAALADTIVSFSEHARALEDPVFHRGASAYDGFNGDGSRTGRAATLGPLDEPPYYAVPILPGTLGTKGGPRTDARGRVLSVKGGVIGSLYAVGNVMAGTTGMVYGGAGGTLGPALTWAWVAGQDAAGAR